ncbi:MerR family transcriptional regulator [Actinomadura darangshiensis]|uniref:MerR family transcriptional regulator n=1 Tax=Actinomadura darangshiensis TaxID=705336 RepID=A0A4R5BR88_9ACTN|nr:MerR family transcriptional regulator [Actinomadura darangshiensis]TDD88499.1 MerR family transcriptional regulator [Actinomadura darangshiensis]
MRIGELSRRTGVNQRLLRYYEEQGLLRPERLASGYREYGEDDVRVVGRIRCLLAAGLNTATIATLLPCVRDDDERLVPTCPDMLAHLSRERDRISGAIEELLHSRSMLDTVIGAGTDAGVFHPAGAG